MITDSVYRIGSGHEVCQDYALHGSNFHKDTHYAIISDGCSSSQDVDVGARLIALEAKACLALDGTYKAEHLLSTLPHMVYKMAEQTAMLLGLDQRCLDATLLGVHSDPYVSNTFIYGDGFFFFMERDDPGVLHVNHFDYSENTPYYLSVEYGEGLKDRFMTIPQVLTHTSYVFRPTGVTKNVQTGISTARYINEVSPSEEFLFVGVASDGWASFLHKDTQAPVSIEEVFSQFVNFPVASEGLLRRRVNKILKGFDKQGITHYDDVSMAIIYNNEV